ncbi:MAG: beta-ketoacyl synthase N-terminal-like domain-containing protein [Lentimicrobium sp.]|nr:beta-ketoacyl synthase N-terminal-like domain-containing protein [Lentimicrobium sp.]MEA5111745.1 beta-ketoacyl synthase N-terminal-like domain-containing protein [Lentimicrobium sp.]
MKPSKKILMIAGYNTISMGTGRREFNPKKERPGLEHYLKEAGQGVLQQIGGAGNVDEGVVGNFMASRFNKQAHLGAFLGMIDPQLRLKPSMRVEGACASGGLALVTGIKSALSGSADVVLALGVEVQNTVKAIYGADILAGAGWFQRRKEGHAYFFPGQFSDRAGVYFEKVGREKSRKAFARWYRNAIENARLCPTAQEYENKTVDLEALALTEPNPKSFTDHLNVFDCSKVSDGASAIAIVTEEGLKRCSVALKHAVEIAGIGHAADDLTALPADPARLDTVAHAVKIALESAGITAGDLATVETHDCFTIAGILGVEAIGLAPQGKGADFVLEGHTARDGKIPFNTTGGLIGWGHPTGATGVHQAVTIWEQMTGKAGAAQINIPAGKPYGLTINMGGDDRTVVAIVYKKTV